MQLKFINLVLLGIILNGCAKTNCSHNRLNLPSFPIAGAKVADELEIICSKPDFCYNLNNWLNEIGYFTLEYGIIYKSNQ